MLNQKKINNEQLKKYIVQLNEMSDVNLSELTWGTNLHTIENTEKRDGFIDIAISNLERIIDITGSKEDELLINYCEHIETVLADYNDLTYNLEDSDFTKDETEARDLIKELSQNFDREFFELEKTIEQLEMESIVFHDDNFVKMKTLLGEYQIDLEKVKEYLDKQTKIKSKIEKFDMHLTQMKQTQNSFNEMNERINYIYEQIEENSKQSAEYLEKMREDIDLKSLAKSAKVFDLLKKNFQKREWAWLSFLGLSIISIFVVIVVSFSYFPENLDNKISLNTFYHAIKRLIFIIPLSVVAKISLGKYNVERNLRIIYEHRMKLMNQYDDFDKEINDQEVKTKLKIDMMKYLFTDPYTGLLNNHNANDLAVSPIVNIIESLSKGQTPK